MVLQPSRTQRIYHRCSLIIWPRLWKSMQKSGPMLQSFCRYMNYYYYYFLFQQLLIVVAASLFQTFGTSSDSIASHQSRKGYRQKQVITTQSNLMSLFIPDTVKVSIHCTVHLYIVCSLVFVSTCLFLALKKYNSRKKKVFMYAVFPTSFFHILFLFPMYPSRFGWRCRGLGRPLPHQVTTN